MREMLIRLGNRDTSNKTQKFHKTSDGLWNNDSKATLYIKPAVRVLFGIFCRNTEEEP